MMIELVFTFRFLSVYSWELRFSGRRGSWSLFILKMMSSTALSLRLLFGRWLRQGGLRGVGPLGEESSREATKDSFLIETLLC